MQRVGRICWECLAHAVIAYLRLARKINAILIQRFLCNQHLGGNTMANSWRSGLGVSVAIIAIFFCPDIGLGQVDISRRELATPGLVVDTGTRTAACYALTYTIH